MGVALTSPVDSSVLLPLPLADTLSGGVLVREGKGEGVVEGERVLDTVMQGLAVEERRGVEVADTFIVFEGLAGLGEVEGEGV